MTQWVVAGASGVVGRRLLEAIKDFGPHELVWVLTRRAGMPSSAVNWVSWKPPRPSPLTLYGETHWFQMAGSSVAAGRLGPKHEAVLSVSRRQAGEALCDMWRRAGRPPGSVTVISATGFFGDRGEEPCSEGDPAGKGPLARVCLGNETWWQDRREELARGGCRLVIARFGMVLDPEAPAVSKLLLPIRLGLGGPFAGGRMWWPWISGVDCGRALVHLARWGKGIYHLTAPEPIRQGELVKTLARAMGRPAMFPTPAWALGALMGQGAQALLINSCRAETPRLVSSGFEFRAQNLEQALPFVLKVFGR